MEVRLVPGIFIRHVKDESIVWCPRSGGCTLLCNVQPILDELGYEWRDVDKIVRSLAARFACEEGFVTEDVMMVVAEIVSQRFAEIRCDDEERALEYQGGCVVSHELSVNINADNDDKSPFGDFYMRHSLPCELHMDLTDSCNERCIHCYLPQNRRHYLDNEIACKVLKEFREAQGMTVYISGGECMLHRDFAGILRFAKSQDLNIVVMSNATLCDNETIKLLKEVAPQFVNVSLYAINEQVHDSITQVSGSCRKTKDAIDKMLSAGVHVRIVTPFMHANKRCVAELQEFAAKRNVHFIADCDIIGEIGQTCANQRCALSLSEFESLVQANRDVFFKAKAEANVCNSTAKVCDIGEGRLNLDAEGQYYPCDGFHGAIIGDAHSDTLMTVWNGDALKKLRALKNGDFGMCASCADRAWCKVCPMRNFNETGNMFTHAPWRCEATRIYRKIFEEK